MSVPRLAYSTAASYMHWVVAFPIVACVGTVLKAQSAPKEEKGEWMFRHKSMGLLSGMLVAPRIGYRLLQSRTAYNVLGLIGNSPLENAAGKVTHYALYAFMTVMPATGIAMGYYGGKGLPFFYKTFKGKEKPNGALAKKAFWWHKNIGVYGKYLIPAHVGAAFLHYFRGQTNFYRINPFRTPRG